MIGQHQIDMQLVQRREAFEQAQIERVQRRGCLADVAVVGVEIGMLVVRVRIAVSVAEARSERNLTSASKERRRGEPKAESERLGAAP